MPPYRDSQESEGDHDESTFEVARRRGMRMFDGFLDFALQGNILEIAFGLMYVFLGLDHVALSSGVLPDKSGLELCHDSLIAHL